MGTTLADDARPRNVQSNPKPCARCGTSFQPTSNASRYCSDGCRNGTATCEGCGGEFMVKGSTSGRWCSAACFRAAERPGKTCPVCQSGYRGSASTCSRACGYELRKRRNPMRNARCGRAQCGASLAGKKPGTRYCTRRCAMLGRVAASGLAAPEGTRRLTGSGYVEVKRGDRWVSEHREAMATVLCRPLLPHERVHHKNGKRDDNRPENLELWHLKRKDPAGIRRADYHCPGCRCHDS